MTLPPGVAIFTLLYGHAFVHRRCTSSVGFSSLHTQCSYTATAFFSCLYPTCCKMQFCTVNSTSAIPL